MKSHDDCLRALRRQKTWVLAPAIAGLVAGVVLAFLWPDTYVSQAVIRVVHAPLSEKIAPPVLNAQLNDRMAQLANDVLSRASLSALIETHRLYPHDRRRLPMEDLVENIRRDIKLTPVGFLPNAMGEPRTRLSAFRVTFEYPHRIAAQRICHDLTSNFINASIRWRTEEGGAVNDMFRMDAEREHRRVAELDARLEAFRAARATSLPEHRPAHLARAGVLEGRLAGMRREASRTAAEIAIEEGRLAELERQRQRPRAASTPAVLAADPAVTAAELQFEALRRRYPRQPSRRDCSTRVAGRCSRPAVPPSGQHRASASGSLLRGPE